MTEPIRGFFNEWRFLSNFEGPGFTHDGIWYPTNEHFYQAWKTNDLTWWNLIRKAPTPGEAKKLGRRAPVIEGWEDVKDQVMWIGLTCKFNGAGDKINQEAANRLYDTEDAYLEETNTWGDRYWGVCNGQGFNKLGYALMNLRGKLGGTSVVSNPTVHTTT